MVNSNKQLSKATKAYYVALQSLINSDRKINFDTVALEAGRGRGAIKGTSVEIIEFKNAILNAKAEQESKAKQKSPVYKLNESNRIKENYRKKYQELIDINQSLMHQLSSAIFEIEELKLELYKITETKNRIIDIKNR